MRPPRRCWCSSAGSASRAASTRASTTSSSRSSPGASRVRSLAAGQTTGGRRWGWTRVRSTGWSPGPGARSTTGCCRRRRWRWPTRASWSLFETFGDATDDTRYVVFSATKAFVAGAMWALIGDGLVDVSKRVVEYVPEFGTERQGRDHRRAGDAAHVRVPAGADAAAAAARRAQGRVERFAKWRLNWEPGTKYQYHPTSAHWVLVGDHRARHRAGLP